MTDIEFSDWYFLFLTPTYNDNNGQAQTSNTNTANPNKLTLTALKSTSKEVAESLSEKLSVPASEFSIISIEEYQVLCSRYIFYFYQPGKIKSTLVYERGEKKPWKKYTLHQSRGQ